MNRHSLSALLLLTIVGLANASKIVLVDTLSAAYLLPSSQELQLKQEQVSSLVAAVTGLVPADRIEEGLSDKVSVTSFGLPLESTLTVVCSLGTLSGQVLCESLLHMLWSMWLA
jgi:hypothetical protein